MTILKSTDDGVMVGLTHVAEYNSSILDWRPARGDDDMPVFHTAR
jgi:hypothetical protein